MMADGSVRRSRGETWGPVSPTNVHETGVAWTVWIPHRGRRGGAGRAKSKKDLVAGPIRGFWALQAPADQGELLKLGIDVSATTIATVLRRGSLGPAPRRIGPTWTQFLRLQAHGVLSRGTRSDEEDGVEDLAMGREREAPASIGEAAVATPKRSYV
jgi:hypothetical protein